MTYEEEMRRQYEVLDQYDFEPYLQIYDDVSDLMFNFEYECNIDNLPQDFEGCVFNYCSMEDFVDYLRKRYPEYNIYEATAYKIQPSKRKEN